MCKGPGVELAGCIQRSEATLAGVKYAKGREVDQAEEAVKGQIVCGFVGPSMECGFDPDIEGS